MLVKSRRSEYGETRPKLPARVVTTAPVKSVLVTRGMDAYHSCGSIAAAERERERERGCHVKKMRFSGDQ
jgi:hypothetical protein